MAAVGGVDVCATSSLVLNESIAIDAITPAEVNGMIFLVIFSVLVCSINLFVFVYYKRSYQRMRVRVGCFTFLYFIGVMLFTTGMALPVIIGFDRFPCWLEFGATTMSIGFFLATNFTRSSTFMLMTRLAVCTYDFGRIPIDETAEAEERQKEMGTLPRTCEELSLIWYALTFFFRPSAIHQNMSREQQIKTLLTLRFVTGIKGSSFFAIVCLIPSITFVGIVIALVPAFAQGCNGCPTNNLALVATIAAFGGLGTFNAVMFAVKCRAFPDTWGVFKEGRLSARGIVFAFIGFLLMGFLPDPVIDRYLLTLMCGFGFCFSFTMVTSYQVYLASKTETRVHQVRSPRPPSKKLSKNNKGSQVESGASTGSANPNNFPGLTNPASDLKSPRLAEVLSNPTVARAFEYHLSTEFGGENLCFLKDVYDWILAYNDISRSASVARAKKLINTYVSNDGFYQINISSQMAAPLLKLLHTKELDSVPRTLFDPARTEIATLLENGPVTRFVTTKEYSNLISGDVVVQNMT